MPAEHVAAHDGGADVRHGLFDDARAVVRDSAVQPLGRPPDGERKHPLVQAHSADAKRILHALIGAGNKAIERYRNFQTKFH